MSKEPLPCNFDFSGMPILHFLDQLTPCRVWQYNSCSLCMFALSMYTLNLLISTTNNIRSHGIYCLHFQLKARNYKYFYWTKNSFTLFEACFLARIVAVSITLWQTASFFHGRFFIVTLAVPCFIPYGFITRFVPCMVRTSIRITGCFSPPLNTTYNQ